MQCIVLIVAPISENGSKLCTQIYSTLVCVVNVFSSHSFKICLFEILETRIRKNTNIYVIILEDTEIKVSKLADDTTCLLKDGFLNFFFNEFL